MLEEQMALLEKHGDCISNEHKHWSENQVMDGSANTQLENLERFYADAKYLETLKLIRENWKATTDRCTELARRLQAGDKGQQPKATKFLGIILKVSPAAGRTRLCGSACEGTGSRSK